MNTDSWTCVMISNGIGVVNDDLRNALKAAACNMHLQKLDRMIIKNPQCDGIMQTEWESYMINTRSGILFRSHIESERGDFQVNFLLSKEDLEAGARIIREMEEGNMGRWEATFEELPVPALYEFRDLRRHRMH